MAIKHAYICMIEVFLVQQISTQSAWSLATKIFLLLCSDKLKKFCNIQKFYIFLLSLVLVTFRLLPDKSAYQISFLYNISMSENCTSTPADRVVRVLLLHTRGNSGSSVIVAFLWSKHNDSLLRLPVKLFHHCKTTSHIMKDIAV